MKAFYGFLIIIGSAGMITTFVILLLSDTINLNQSDWLFVSAMVSMLIALIGSGRLAMDEIKRGGVK